MHNLFGTETAKDLNEIQRHLTYINLIKQEHIDFLNLCIPMIATTDHKNRTSVIDLANSLYFGESEGKKEKLDETKQVMKELQANLLKIKTLGSVELEGEAAMNAVKNTRNLKLSNQCTTKHNPKEILVTTCGRPKRRVIRY